MPVYNSYTIKETMGCGRDLYITFVKQDSKLVKLIIHLGKSGQCHRSLLEGIQNLINQVLEDNDNGVEAVIRCLKGLRCDKPTPRLLSCPDYIARLLEQEVSGSGGT